MKNILITGGTGYIGSHTCIPLLEKGYRLTIIDSSVNSSPISILKVKEILKDNFKDESITYYPGDIRDKPFLSSVFLKAKELKNPIQGVIHFAGLKAVSESLLKPLDYWHSNVYGSICLIEEMLKYGCRNRFRFK